MNKKTKIILIIFFTLFSFIIIFTTYFGFDRYLSILLYSKYSNNNKYIKNYHKLNEFSPKQSNIIISLSANYEELNKIKPCINSILDQTIRINKIYLFVIGNNDLQDIPAYLKEIVIIVPTKDYKDNTKIISILIKEKEADTIILSLENNIIYGKDFIEIMLEEMIKNQNTILIDSKNTCILFKPLYFNTEIINKKYFINDNKIIENIEHNKIINYNENYKI
jgi:hypothetical protein